jgi:hypothetical protein
LPDEPNSLEPNGWGFFGSPIQRAPATKSSGKMGNSRKFPVFVRAKWNNPAAHYVDRSPVSSIPFESQSASLTMTFPKLKKEDGNPKQLGDI